MKVSAFTRLFNMKKKSIYTIIESQQHQVTNMSSLIGSIFGGTSMSALLLGAFNVHVESAANALLISLFGGVVFTFLAYSVDKKNSLTE